MMIDGTAGGIGRTGQTEFKTGIDDMIYGEKYNRIASRMEELKTRGPAILATIAEIPA
ncbi:hypothetical protein [Sporomusa termitida]|uniref:hypothetical protein n=1 Tax=Sporomusa termitida TaxID=2377 RepID=UPI0014783E11|nr:hypothetical protein [Sporomusa termitida]